LKKRLSIAAGQGHAATDDASISTVRQTRLHQFDEQQRDVPERDNV